MSQQVLPRGWSVERVQQLIAHCDAMTDDEWTAEDEAAYEVVEQTLMLVPTSLVPKIRESISKANA